MIPAKKVIKNKLLLIENLIYSLLYKSNDSYGELGFFVKNNKTCNKYFYSNWGSRLGDIFIKKMA
jgi:hypothetical protein